MPVETITREGDFVINDGPGCDMLRVHADEDSFTMSMSAPSSFLCIAAEEAKELRDWLTRRLTESL